MVVKGDVPVNIFWNLNGKPIHGIPGVTVVPMGPKAIGLTIESVSSIHRGTFTCFAENSAGHTNHSAELSVNGTHSSLVIIFFLY